MPGDIPWQKFTFAMAAVGFSVQKLCGSAWQFVPPKDMTPQHGIHFHEPHPYGKLQFRVARHMGRRLSKAYNLDIGSFEL
jgi:hypothetical protein